jgi:hypothetical protein
LTTKNWQRIYILRTTRAHLPVYSAIIMEAMRNSWTDDRLDGFSKETYRRFDEVDRHIGEVERHMEQGFARVDGEFRALRSEMNTRFDSLQRTMMQLGSGAILALIGLIATQI